ncbi:anaphase-promoting complex subunit 5 [Melghirimyces profundicolus]|uniref:Anaphase-promoting complex subunit 5 n=1 Tax=Melghirimyces profundicolus TaxID=1242148 RepID=A0A2T6AY28_9BACL|nr:helix-turn-helix domain-containing protein [Melghirimyces profundicolus]PTX48721.1 anaphase-promoting complex subunit 5 [Melghirimyces profundicolus]
MYTSKLDIHELGELVRRIRKEKGFRLEDLADDKISPATISNIERGVPHVSPQKAMYLLEKLKIEPEEIPKLILGEKEKLEKDHFYIQMADLKRESGDPEGALQDLKDLKYPDDHPLAPMASYVNGKCHRDLKKWTKAERCFNTGIRLSSQLPESTNIHAVCLAELGLCRYLQNDLNDALKYTENAIQVFDRNGDRKDAWYLLQSNKGLYLERMGRVGEAWRVVEDNWDERDQMENVWDKLTFYWLRSELSYRMGMLEDAIRCAREGLELARINKIYHAIFTLSTVLGSTYIKLGELVQAEQSFQTALDFQPKIDNKKTVTVAYIRLGMLYKMKNQIGEALDALQNGIENSREHNDAPRLTYALLVLGDLHQSSGKQEEAIAAYQDALSLAQTHQYKKREHRALYSLARCYKDSNEQEFQKCMVNMYLVQTELRQAEEDFFDEVE